MAIGDMHDMPFEDNSFDIIVSAGFWVIALTSKKLLLKLLGVLSRMDWLVGEQWDPQPASVIKIMQDNVFCPRRYRNKVHG